jgi:hypothetical protein
MEGWLYGLFTLVGVLAGGLFTYLGMKKQLEQQSELDSRHWKREVRSEPLLRLRTELARMANKQDKLVAVVYKQYSKRFAFLEEELKETLDDSNSYLASGDFANALFTLDNAEIVHKAREILTNYQESLMEATSFSKLKKEERIKALESIETNREKVIETQALINKRLEEL